MSNIAPLEARPRVVQGPGGDEGEVRFGLPVIRVGIVLPDERPIAALELPVQGEYSFPQGILELIQGGRMVEVLVAQGFLQRPAAVIQAHQRLQAFPAWHRDAVIERFKRRENFALRPIGLQKGHVRHPAWPLPILTRPGRRFFS